MSIGLKALFVILGAGIYVVWGLVFRLVYGRNAGNTQPGEPGNAGASGPSPDEDAAGAVTGRRMIPAGVTVSALTLATVMVLLWIAPEVTIASVGWRIAGPDLVFMAMVLVIFLIQTAGGRVLARRRTSLKGAGAGAGGADAGLTGRRATESPAADLVSVVAALILIAVQEELLFRGYIRVIVDTGQIRFILLSTGLYVLVRAIAGRINVLNVVNWIVGGLTLGFVYIVSRSIWVAVFVHLLTNLKDVSEVSIPGTGRLLNVNLPAGVDGGAVCRLVLTAATFIVAGVWYLFFAYV